MAVATLGPITSVNSSEAEREASVLVHLPDEAQRMAPFRHGHVDPQRRHLGRRR